MSEPSRVPPQIQTSFRAVVHTETAGGYWAEVPDLPGCFTQGDTLDEVYHNLAEAIAGHLDLEPAAVRISLLEMANDA
jgi:predicted RNase H-like HicB family nuclease